MISLPLTLLRDTAALRPPGYLDDVMSSGRITPDGLSLELPDDVHRTLLQRYRPGLGSQAATALQSTAEWAAAGMPVVTPTEHHARACHCYLCPHYSARLSVCLLCMCTGVKLWMATSRCPAGRW